MTPVTADPTNIPHRVVAAPGSGVLARYAPVAARVSLGLIFFIFGLDGFLSFMPKPATPLPPAAQSFFAALINTGYLFRVVKGTEVLVGTLLLSNRFVPLALALIAPVVVNIFGFDTLLAPSGAAIGTVVLALEVYLAWTYRKVYRPMLAMRVSQS